MSIPNGPETSATLLSQRQLLAVHLAAARQVCAYNLSGSKPVTDDHLKKITMAHSGLSAFLSASDKATNKKTPDPALARKQTPHDFTPRPQAGPGFTPIAARVGASFAADVAGHALATMAGGAFGGALYLGYAAGRGLHTLVRGAAVPSSPTRAGGSFAEEIEQRKTAEGLLRGVRRQTRNVADLMVNPKMAITVPGVVSERKKAEQGEYRAFADETDGKNSHISLLETGTVSAAAVRRFAQRHFEPTRAQQAALTPSFA